MMQGVIGIDGGGTKTVCVLMNQTGQVLGRGVAGPANYQTVGLTCAFESIQQAISLAIQAAVTDENKGNLIEVEGICLGLAGAGRPADVQALQGLVNQLQTSENLPLIWSLKTDPMICHDCAIALTGGIGEPIGIVTIAGTGAITYGQNRAGQTKRASGWGYKLGDEGSGYDIGLRGLRAVVRAQDGRSEATQLREHLCRHLQINQVEDLVELVYRRGWGVTEIAALAKIVDEVAVAGDAVANQIIDEAVAELVLSTRVVSEALFLPEEGFEVVTMGGVWQGMAGLRSRFIDQLAAVVPSAKVIWARHEPAYGAGLLVLKAISS
jgi:N-acetylglucosamine kinase-like BadF-type ATPase